MKNNCDLSFKRAFEIAQGMEATHWYVKDLGGQKQLEGEKKLLYTNQGARERAINKNKWQMLSLWENHKPEQCIQKKRKCHHCLKIGQLMHWCHSRQPNQNGLKSAATQSDVDCRYSICTDHFTSTDTDYNQSGRKYH